MLKSLICFGLLAVIVNLCSATSPVEVENVSQDGNSFVQFVSSDKLAGVLEKYPNAVEIGRTLTADLGRSATAQSRVLVTYTLGSRVFGDFLVAHDSQEHTWLSQQDVRLRIDYPTAGGIGAIVTHVQIVVNQSNDVGTAYVVAGGIGYRYISLIVEAKGTYWFDYDTSIFGHN